MTALVALWTAIVALVISGASAAAVMAWHHDHRRLDELAGRLQVDCRIEALTVQTMAAMRDAVRGGGRQ
jgi:hypothetical protein